MPKFARPQDLPEEFSTVTEMARGLLSRFETHATLTDNHVKIDFLFAFADVDESTGEVTGDALKLHGVKALGIARKLGPKDRAKGLGDAEICLDGDWWTAASHEEREALLDHEMHHICGTDKRDNLGRPVIKMRKHDWQFGWFNIIAARHGAHSQEQKQAIAMMEVSGQFYWPGFVTPQFKASRLRHMEFDADGDKLSKPIQKAMATIGEAIGKGK